MELASFLKEPTLRDIDLESIERISRHRDILNKKPMIRDVFSDFYRLCRALDEKHFEGVSGLRVELGAGVSFIKEEYRDVLVTDVDRAPHLDRVLDAHKMNLPAESVRAFYGINCFHHFASPEDFFSELVRVLADGGGCILIEPYYGPLSSVIYKYLFTTESFDKKTREWESRAGHMRGANQALSFIVFKRDRNLFEMKFPDLEILEQFPLENYGRYLLSGGLNFKRIAPGVVFPALKLLEKFLKPLNPVFSLHHAIVIKKRRKETPCHPS